MRECGEGGLRLKQNFTYVGCEESDTTKREGAASCDGGQISYCAG